MKRGKLLILPLLGTLILTSLFSCGVDRWPEYYPETGRDIWIDSVMRQVFLWYKDMPSPAAPDYFQEPAEFLKKAVASMDKGFSNIDSLLDEPIPSYGFDYSLYKVLDNDTAYNALISYIVPGSPAEEAGLKRGHWIMMLDGDYITKKVEPELQQGGVRTLQIGVYKEVVGEDGKTTGSVVPIGDTTISASRSLTDKPVHYFDVIPWDGKTVGYLMYNEFKAGSTADSQTYNDDLRKVFRKFQTDGVNEFVLDLRYNTGGSLDCVQLLCTMLAPADKMNQLLVLLRYNDKRVESNQDLTFNPELIQSGANLNLSTVYVLTTNATRGAAEMVINCLNPYMKVILIGTQTAGEYVATEPFVHPTDRFILNLAVCNVFNVQEKSDYVNGFKPAYEYNEDSYLSTYLPFGNTNETLLSVALKTMSGVSENGGGEGTTRMVVTKRLMKFHPRRGLTLGISEK